MSTETVRKMLAPHDLPGGIRALGWDMQSSYSANRGQSLSRRAVGHGGYTGTALWIDPQKDLFVLFLSNRVHPDGKGAINALAGQIGTLAGESLAEPARTRAGSTRARRGGDRCAQARRVRTASRGPRRALGQRQRARGERRAHDRGVRESTRVVFGGAAHPRARQERPTRRADLRFGRALAAGAGVQPLRQGSAAHPSDAHRDRYPRRRSPRRRRPLLYVRVDVARDHEGSRDTRLTRGGARSAEPHRRRRCRGPGARRPPSDRS